MVDVKKKDDEGSKEPSEVSHAALDEAFRAGVASVKIPPDRYDEGFKAGTDSVKIPPDRYDEGFKAGTDSVKIPSDRYGEGFRAGSASVKPHSAGDRHVALDDVLRLLDDRIAHGLVTDRLTTIEIRDLIASMK